MEKHAPLSRLLLAPLLASLFLFCSSHAAVAAAPPWQPAKTIGVEAIKPEIGVDGRGEAIAVWQQIDAHEYLERRQSQVLTATRAPGGTWSPATTLSQDGYKPQIAIGASGEAIVVWASSGDPDSMAFEIQAASRRPDGTWTPTTILAAEPRYQGAFQIDIAANPTGEAVAVWDGVEDRQSVLRSASRTPDGDWSAPLGVPGSGDDYGPGEPQIAIAPSGKAVAVWSQYELWSSHHVLYPVIESASRSSAGVWSRSAKLSHGRQICTDPQVALDPKGEAVAVWNCGEQARFPSVQSASRPADGDWSPIQRITRAPSHRSSAPQFSEPQLAMNTTGEAVAIWSRTGNDHSALESARHPLSGNWSAPDLVTRDFAWAPRVGMDAAGGATAVWVSGGKVQTVQGAMLRPGGSWSSPTALSSRSRRNFEAQLAVSPVGEAIAIWRRRGAKHSVVETSSHP